ncbi:MAG TPA: PHP domain-containing protein [Actinomycetota bacterium]
MGTATPGQAPTNAALAELLAVAAEAEADHRARALRRASRAALTWPEEAAAVEAGGRSLTELRGVGPWVAKRILGWLEDPPPASEPQDTRRGFMTLAEARGILAAHPDIRLLADLQTHSTWSDGSASLREMAEACAAIGHEHVLATDHSKGLPIANGMDEERLAAQAREVAETNRALADDGVGIRILHGIEMNLSPQGEGDMDPAALATLDVVLGAFHSKLRVTDDQTVRYLAALANPDIHVLAHPRGRKWNIRTGLNADWAAVADQAAVRDKALEIDGYPDRQDAAPELRREMARTGCWVSIGTDAHAPWELAFWEMGLALALDAGIRTDRILNLMPAEDLLSWARER